MFRAMKAENADRDRPVVGSKRGELGVRLPGGAGKADVAPDPHGIVCPGGGGMSISPSLRQLPYFLIPRRLKNVLGLREATAPNDWHVWRMGSHPFSASAIGPDLYLRPDGDDHGLVEPSRSMHVNDYQSSLAATREEWKVDEQ